MSKSLRTIAACVIAAAVLDTLPTTVRAQETCELATIEAGATVDIKGGGSDWRACLIKALGSDGALVRLGPDVDMDMTGVATPIDIAVGVTFTSVASFDQPVPSPRRPNVTGPVRGFARPPAATDPGAGSTSRDTGRPEGGPQADVLDPMPRPLSPEARSPRSLGPRIWTRDKPKALFQIRCFPDGALNDNVRISGFRLEGAEKHTGSTGSSIGIQTLSCINITISNMEIFGWSNAGIFSGDRDDLPRVVSNQQVRISDSFFHHNQHTGGSGYGINPQAATIERNVFDHNRHAITTGGDAVGYIASRNLVLKGGGYHGYGGLAYTHQFDVHGTDDCWGDKNCGRAAKELTFFENTFQYRHDHAIGIRGTPVFSARIDRNIFAHEDVRDPYLGEGAVRLYQGDRRIQFGSGINANIGGRDTFGKYGVCDFDGDGKDDLFLPTGVTWWFASAGRFHWSYLNALGGSLGDLRLGYFDDDASCDVLVDNGREWMISRGGRTPWERFGAFGSRLSDVAFGRFDASVRDQLPNATRKTTHAFRTREGQWEVTSLAAPNWQRVQGSGKAMNKLRFGDFTGDGVTDVLAIENGRWSISESATGGWDTLNPSLGDDLQSVLIADIDNNNRDDVIRLVSKPRGAPQVLQTWDVGWQVSWDGRTPWQTLRFYTFNFKKDAGTVFPVYRFAGRFDDAAGADLLTVDPERRGNFINNARAGWRSFNAY